jgi:hypothetical protein
MIRYSFLDKGGTCPACPESFYNCPEYVAEQHNVPVTDPRIIAVKGEWPFYVPINEVR